MAEFVTGVLMEMYSDQEIDLTAFRETLEKAFPGTDIKIRSFDCSEE